MNQILEFRKQNPALSSGNPSEKISLAVFHRWQPLVKLQQNDKETVDRLWQYGTDRNRSVPPMIHLPLVISRPLVLFPPPSPLQIINLEKRVPPSCCVLPAESTAPCLNSVPALLIQPEYFMCILGIIYMEQF